MSLPSPNDNDSSAAFGCAVCGVSSHQDHDSVALEPCQLCAMVEYCSSQHLRTDMRAHAKDCAGLRRGPFLSRADVSFLMETQGERHVEQTFARGIIHYYGIYVKRDLAMAAQLYEEAAELGFAHAQLNIGLCYARGEGVQVDNVQAARWFQRAVSQGMKKAQRYLDELDLEVGSAPSPKLGGFLQYQAAAKAGDPEAQCSLGVCYANGGGVDQDFDQAAKWFEQAALQGNSLAQCNLGLCYAKGEGVEQSDEQAVQWYAKSAEQGYARAQFSLGMCYTNGEGVARDLAEAKDWIRRSANQELDVALYTMGVFYENGIGVDKDKAKAVQYFKKASALGCVGPS